MKKIFSLFAVLFFSCFSSAHGIILETSVPGLTAEALNDQRTDPGTSKLDINFAEIPLYFIANEGQVDDTAEFYAKASRYTLWLTKKGMVFDALRDIGGKKPGMNNRHTRTMKRDVSEFFFVDANNDPVMMPVEETGHRVNYIIGNDRSKWHSSISTSRAVLYKGLYKGIDLKVYGIEKQIEYDWIIRPGQDPGAISFEYRGVKGTRIDDKGNLLVETDSGELIHKRPFSYQEVDNKKIEVIAQYRKTGENTYGFEVGEYDTSHTLIIDPVVLTYSTYLGGSGGDAGYGIAVDSSGYAYVTGNAGNSTFPKTTGAYQTTFGGSADAFVTKLNVDGSALVYSTYLGGTGNDQGRGIAVDSSGYAYVAGMTASDDFPMTMGGYQTTKGGSTGSFDAFVTKLNADGSDLLYSTFLGGSSEDYGYAIGVDSYGNAYVTGNTSSSSDFPTNNAYQTSLNGSWDVFVSKISTGLSGSASLIYSTYLGGSSTYTPTTPNSHLDENEKGWGIAVDSSGKAYVTGYTYSSDFPSKNPFQGTFGGGTDVSDAFITVIDPAQTTIDTLIYSTYLGGSAMDDGRGIAIDSSGYAYVSGWTASTDFPTNNAYQPSIGGDNDAFVSSINPSISGSSGLLYSTYLGGTLNDHCYGIAVDSSQRAYVSGDAASTDFPTKDPYQSSLNNSTDAIAARIDTAQSGSDSLVYSTYLGGALSDHGMGIAVDNGNNAYVTGYTYSTDFPTKTPYLPNLAGSSDAFVSKLSYSGSPTLTYFIPTSGSTGTSVGISGTNLTSTTAVTFGGTPATSVTVHSSTYITAVVGAGATGKVVVTTPGGTATSSRDFTFMTTSTAITGKLTDAGGQPMQIGEICAQPFTTGGQTWWCTNPQADGTYSLAVLPGYARVYAANTSEGYLTEYYDNSYASNRATAVWVTAGQTTPSIDFSMGKNGSISGTVYKADGTTPLSNVCVDAYSNQCGSSRYAFAQTDTDGNYTIPNLPPQAYYLRTRASCTTPQHYTDYWWNSGGPATFCDQAGPVTVTSEQNTSGINFSLSPSQATYPGPSFRSTGVYASHNANASITTVFYAFINGPSPEDVVSVTATGPSGTFSLGLNQKPFRQSGHFYSAGSGSVVDNGTYTFVIIDSLGRTATVTRDFTYNSTIPQVDSNTMKVNGLGNQAYVGAATPTLTWNAVTWPGTPGYYQAAVYDYDGKAIWYIGTTEGTSVTIPEGYLQPDSAYYWWVRTMDIPATGEKGQNRRYSNTLYFYTGTKGLPDLSNKVSLSFTHPEFPMNWFAAWSIKLAPWDIDSLNVTGPRGTVYPYKNRAYFLNRPIYYACPSVGGPFPAPDGTYTFQLSDKDSNTDTQTQDFTYNPVPTVSEASRSPAPNAYGYTSRTFSWDPVSDSRTLFYKLRIRDYNSQIVWYDSPYTTETSWTIPDDIPIGPTGPYKWQVLVSDRATTPNNLSMSALRTVTSEPLSTNNYALRSGIGLRTDYRIFTVPFYMGSGANILKQMENVLGPYNQALWRVFALVNGSNIELNTADFAALTITPGMGFWIITLYDNTVPFEGALCPQNTNYQRTLSTGWHHIALPWPATDITLGSITVSDGLHTYAITDDTNDLTQTSLWEYTGSGPFSGYEKRQIAGYPLQHGVGYYIKILSTSNITVTIPPTSTTSAIATTSNGLKSPRRTNEEPPPGSPHQGMTRSPLRLQEAGVLPLPPDGIIHNNRARIIPSVQRHAVDRVVANEEFDSGTPCECYCHRIHYQSSENVKIKGNANVTFKAPMESTCGVGFIREEGAVVNIKQQ